MEVYIYVHANKIHILPNTYFIVFNKRAYVKCNDLEKNKYFNEMREITIWNTKLWFIFFFKNI